MRERGRGKERKGGEGRGRWKEGRKSNPSASGVHSPSSTILSGCHLKGSSQSSALRGPRVTLTTQSMQCTDIGDEHIPNVSFIIAGSIQERHNTGGREKIKITHCQ